ncbi:M3 family oligoendopeptidase [Amphibacillus cookii]|uniref:M3 family oligoendopeptidase n=1 Tax=Amphibacillus cookii TaxID=767787 RepID=UPI0019563FB5|nr:pepF/M3 family oligoendopeptidase [Amphibacillus cookii]
MAKKYNDTWNLDNIFVGGTKSATLQTKLEGVSQLINNYQTSLHNWKNTTPHTDVFIDLLTQQEAIEKALGQVATFINMCHDAYTNDTHAIVVKGQVMTQYSELKKLLNQFTKKVVAIPAPDWHMLLKHNKLAKIAFPLNELRSKGSRLRSEAEEALIAELHKDGLSGWSDLYATVVSTMTIPFTDKQGETETLSVGQAMNRMYADPDPAVRQQLFNNWENAWQKQAPIFTDILNHLDGYRITLQNKHDYKDHLEEPLEYNRMTKATLDAMWQAIDKHKQPFIDFLNKKAELFGMEKLGWQDVEAPLALDDDQAKSFSYDQACDFIIEHFSSFGSELTDFAKHALTNQWVEAEDRPNKRPGGYCASLPEFNESRIFMTFTGSASDTGTLAHELGHAFHSHVLKDAPYLNRHYAMNVAETASTFAETIIANATVQQAQSKQEKLVLLNTKLENATAMFMNIHARFLFEDAFYKERADGVVSTERLNTLMINAQKEAFGDALSSYHPHFWCSKLHFFIDDIPFYNFPYTFGFLFSLGVYAKYLESPEGFEAKYIALLKDTGAMTVEDLAKKHLDVDLTDQSFWTNGIQLMVKDVESFIELADQLA